MSGHTKLTLGSAIIALLGLGHAIPLQATALAGPEFLSNVVDITHATWSVVEFFKAILRQRALTTPSFGFSSSTLLR